MGPSREPEQEARSEIDELLGLAGWSVQDVADTNLRAARGVAIREFPLKRGHGFADYMLYVDGKAAGVVEAKKRGVTLNGVEIQAERYAAGLPDGLPSWLQPLPFAYHGYPSLIHRLTYRRTNHANLHVRGYNEEGTTTTPFDMAVLNRIDRFHLVEAVIDRVKGLELRAADLARAIRDKLIDHKRYIERYGDDMPEIRDWRWDARRAAASVTK